MSAIRHPKLTPCFRRTYDFDYVLSEAPTRTDLSFSDTMIPIYCLIFIAAGLLPRSRMCREDIFSVGDDGVRSLN